MAKFVVYRGQKIMDGTEAWEKYHNPPVIKKVPNAPTSLDMHLAELDTKWRKMEGRKPKDQLNEREKILEGLIPWDPVRLKELN